MNIFNRLFKRKQTMGVGFTTEPSSVGFPSKEDVLKEMKRKPFLTHAEINVLSHLYFGVSFKNIYYKLRNADGYGLYFEIKDTHLVVDQKNNKLLDIILTFHDVSFNTSLKLTISVKEINEMFEEFSPDFGFLNKK